MRMLFTILSTVFISFSGIKTNLNINNTSINNQNVQLPILEIRQTEENYCGPAVASSFIEFQTGHIYNQEYLAHEMHIDAHGVGPEDLARTILTHNCGGHINMYVEELAQHFGISNDNRILFAHIVYSSLLKSVPVIIGINGTVPWWGSHASAIQHYIIISGLSGDINDPNNLNYIVMDPADGRSHVLTSNNIQNMFTNGLGYYFVA